jgi:hypothetical protein
MWEGNFLLGDGVFRRHTKIEAVMIAGSPSLLRAAQADKKTQSKKKFSLTTGTINNGS